MGKEKEKIVLGAEGVYDARKLGVPKMLVLGFQHTFAMFGATVWYPSSRVSMCLRLCCLRAWARCCSTLSQKGRCLRFSVPALRFWAAMLRLHRLALTERPARCCRMRQAAW